MDEQHFIENLRRAGRSEAAAARCAHIARVFEEFLLAQCDLPLSETSPQELDIFVHWADGARNPKTKTYLWGLIYYFEYIENSKLKAYASMLRQERIVRKPFMLSKFRGVSSEYSNKLRSIGITSVEDMLAQGATKKQRQTLASKTGIPESAIREF